VSHKKICLEKGEEKKGKKSEVGKKKKVGEREKETTIKGG